MQLAWDEEDSTQVAIKFVARGSAYLSRAAEREILNHRLLTGHAHIVQFKEVQFLILGRALSVRLTAPACMIPNPSGMALDPAGARQRHTCAEAPSCGHPQATQGLFTRS